MKIDERPTHALQDETPSVTSTAGTTDELSAMLVKERPLWQRFMVMFVTYAMVFQMCMGDFSRAYAADNPAGGIVPAEDTSATDNSSSSSGVSDSGGEEEQDSGGIAADDQGDDEQEGAEQSSGSSVEVGESDESEETATSTGAQSDAPATETTTAEAKDKTDEQPKERTGLDIPSNLVGAGSVLAQSYDEGTYDVAQHLNPSLAVSGPTRVGYAELDSNDESQPKDRGAYLVGSSARGNELPAKLTFDLGNTKERLADGYVAGSESRDALTISIDVPYYHYGVTGEANTPSEDATPTRTLSKKEWLLAWGDVYGFRAALTASELPEGWDLYQEFDGEYFKVTKLALRQGISGHIIARWVGNDGKVDTTATPLELNLTYIEGTNEAWGRTPDDFVAHVGWGWEAHTYTHPNKDGVAHEEIVEKGKAGTSKDGRIDVPDAKTDQACSGWQAGELAISSGATKLFAHADVTTATAMESDQAWLGHLVTLSLDQDSPNATKEELHASMADSTGKSVLVRRMVVQDVTNLSSEERAALDPTQMEATDDPSASWEDTITQREARTYYVGICADLEAGQYVTTLDLTAGTEATDKGVAYTARVTAEDTVQASQEEDASKNEPDDKDLPGSKVADTDPADEAASKDEEPTEEQPAKEDASLFARLMSVNRKMLMATSSANLNALPGVTQYFQPFLFYRDGGVDVTDANVPAGTKHLIVTPTSSPNVEIWFNQSNVIPNNSSYYGSEQDRLMFWLDVPYIYNNTEGHKERTLAKDEYEEKIQQAPQYNQGAASDPWCLKVMFNNFSDVFDNWDVYIESPRNDGHEAEEDSGPLSSSQLSAGVTGRIRLEYKGNGSRYAPGSENYLPRFKIAFSGQVPENTFEDVTFSARLSSYTDASGTTYVAENPSDARTVQSGDSTNLRRLVLIKSSLKWTLDVEPQEEPALWDRYNYQSYYVTITNTSDTPESVIDWYNLVLSPSTASVSPNETGMLQEDIMAWLYNNGGTPIRNTASTVGFVATAKNAMEKFIGVPNEGGVLIYDVTNTPQTTLDAVDMVSYSNANDLLGKPLWYTTDGMDGEVSHVFTMSETGKFSNDGTSNAYRKFLVAFPFSTVAVLAGDGSGYASTVLRSDATIYIGNLGDDQGYPFKHSDVKDTQFKQAKNHMSVNKYAYDLESKIWKTTEKRVAKGALGSPSAYEIRDIKIRGNTPVYGPYPNPTDPVVVLSDWRNPGHSSTGNGAIIRDELPDHFELRNIQVKLTLDSGEMPEGYLYMNGAHPVMEYSKDGLTWYTLESSGLAWTHTATSNGTKTDHVYSIGVDSGVLGLDPTGVFGRIFASTAGSASVNPPKYVRLKLAKLLPYEPFKEYDDTTERTLPLSIRLNGYLEYQGPTYKYKNYVTGLYSYPWWSYEKKAMRAWTSVLPTKWWPYTRLQTQFRA